MTKMKDGGQAFPHGDPTNGGDTGMSLRDYFAAKAMQAEMITTFSDATPEAEDAFIAEAKSMKHGVLEHLAFNSYLIADAMLAQRDKS